MNDGEALLTFAVVSSGLLLWAMIAKARRRGGGAGATAPEWSKALGDNGTADRPFEPTLSGPGIALDDRHDWLWLATDEHGHRLLDRSTLLSWKYEWENVLINGANEVWNNRLVFRTTDLVTPLLKVSFGRDKATAELWHARLTTWLQR